MDCILGLDNLVSSWFSWLTGAREGVAKEGVESVAKEVSERQVQLDCCSNSSGFSCCCVSYYMYLMY